MVYSIFIYSRYFVTGENTRSWQTPLLRARSNVPFGTQSTLYLHLRSAFRPFLEKPVYELFYYPIKGKKKQYSHDDWYNKCKD